MMIPRAASCQLLGHRRVVYLCGLIGTVLATAPVSAEPPPPGQEPAPLVLSLNDAVAWALEHSPDLAAIRQQHGIAAAAVIIARTYPFNPLFQNLLLAANGPVSSGLSNHVFVEPTVRLDLEVRGQGKYRRQAAGAALSRTDWEIANQETLLAVRVMRAFNTFIYRREKLRLLDESVRFQEQTAREIGKLVEQSRLRRSDLLLAQADVADIRAGRGPAYNLAVAAGYDLSRLLGVMPGPFDVQGSLEAPPLALEGADLMQLALEHRPDRQALMMAVREAEARTRLEVANRYGNPGAGPAFEYNETRDYFIGITTSWAIPVLNTRQGEVQMRRAEQQRAALTYQANEFQIERDVQAARARLENAARVVNTFRTETLPTLRQMQEGIDKLFAQGDPGADVVRVIEIRRRLLRSRDLFLDALFEYLQAQADLAAALGDPTLALLPQPGPPAPEVLPPPKP